MAVEARSEVVGSLLRPPRLTEARERLERGGLGPTEFKQVEAAMLLSSGFMANLGVVPALVGRGDRVYSDELNHASIVDACRLSGAEIVRYPHADADALRGLISSAPGEPPDIELARQFA